MTSAEKSDALIGEIFKLLPGVAGVMLALIWGLGGDSPPSHDVLVLIRIASVVLAVTIISALLGLQLMVSAFQDGADDAGRRGSVAFCFFVAWLSFIAGCGLVIWSVFRI